MNRASSLLLLYAPGRPVSNKQALELSPNVGATVLNEVVQRFKVSA